MIRWVDRGTELLSAVLLLALLMVVSLGVITRGLDDPLVWTDELSRFLMIWLACLGWTLAGRKRAHIRIRFFVNLLPLRLQNAAECVMQGAVMLFGALVAVWGIELVQRNWTLEATTLPISMSLMYIPLVLVGATTTAQGAAELLDRFQPQ